MKNVAIGKMGKAILFDESKWGAVGGDNEAPMIFQKMFQLNPDTNFWIIGGSDFHKLSYEKRKEIAPHHNVFSLRSPSYWDEYSNYWNGGGYKDLTGYDSDFIMDVTGTGKPDDSKMGMAKRVWHIDWLLKKNILPKMDAGLFFYGMIASTTVFLKAKNIDLTKHTMPLMSIANYTGPIVNFINMTNIPWICLSNDPRPFKASNRDIINRPRKILTQVEETFKLKSIKDYDSTAEPYSIKSEYGHNEKMFLIDKNKARPKAVSLDSLFSDDQEPKKDIKFMIVLNEGSPSRYDQLNKYVLKDVTDVDIYGKWSDDVMKDSRFKGPKKFNELQDMLHRVKYTFAIPIKEKWVTAKFWEMIQYDIIPFLHPTYDSDNLLDLPRHLRGILVVNNSRQLQEKIDFFENNAKAYDKIVSELKSLIKPEYYTGEFLNNLYMSELEKISE